MRRQAKKFAKDGSVGSALILTVVLTSLLAIVGVLFLMMARVNKITASSISKNKELDSAVETVIAKISEELILDVPGVAGAEYYDYPGPGDKWLAGLEPYKDGNDYKWRQISDVYEKLGPNIGLVAKIIPDHQDSSDVNEGKPADADGDGVADSKWVELADMTSSKGKPVYAAIRIVDNGGMINVNTAYKFDPNDLNVKHIDGSSQLQINLMALAGRPPLPTWPVGNPHTLSDEIDLRKARANGIDVDPYLQYQNSVIWSYGEPAPYTPFDVSDELELRYRFLLNHTGIDTRLEDWGGEFRSTVIETPVESGGLDEWFKRASFNPAILDPSINPKDPNYYAYRHIATTYNMDRIIDPNGKKMVNVNRINDINDVNSLYTALLKGLDPCLADANKVAAQIAVNLKDYIDSDSNVTSFTPDVNGPAYYGFERPCIYISELACRLKQDSDDPNKYYRSYAVELYKPYSGDDNPDPNWQLVIKDPNSTVYVNWSVASQYHVIKWEDPCVPLAVDANASTQPPYINPVSNIVFDVNSTILLTRKIDGNDVVVDSKIVPGGWMGIDGNPHSIQRDITQHKCIRRLWKDADEPNSLGTYNSYLSGDPNIIQAHPYLEPLVYGTQGFKNIGEIGMIFRRDAYEMSGTKIGPNDTEATVRIDFTKPEFRQIFNYLTVIDPYNFHPGDANYVNETRIKGRININTAPWFVLAQLPWMQYQDSNVAPRAKAITDYRDSPSQQGFWNIGELMLVGRMQDLGADGKDNWNSVAPPNKGPDITDDTARDDFEERDLIFARISDLVTVRSDVFTAYILVRIGTDGPQKRVIAIFDRSNVYFSDDGKMRVLAVQPVADPR